MSLNSIFNILFCDGNCSLNSHLECIESPAYPETVSRNPMMSVGHNLLHTIHSEFFLNSVGRLSTKRIYCIFAHAHCSFSINTININKIMSGNYYYLFVSCISNVSSYKLWNSINFFFLLFCFVLAHSHWARVKATENRNEEIFF